MDDDKKDVEHALDDIFDGDFIDKETDDVKNYDSFNNTSSISFVDSSKEDIKKIEQKEEKSNDVNLLFNNIEEEKEKIESNVDNSNIVSEVSNNEKKEEITYNKVIVKRKKKKNTKQEIVKKEKKENLFKKLIFKRKLKNKDDKNGTKKFVIIMGSVIAIMILFIISYNIFFKVKTVNYYYSAKLKEYKIIDKYQITKKGNKILSVIGTYKYEVLNDSYKDQLLYIKEEKLPVIINSNSMPGFTYLYEETDKSLSVDSYLDFTKFEYDKINKIDQKKKPISYFKISDKLTYKKFRKYLENKGYIIKN